MDSYCRSFTTSVETFSLKSSCKRNQLETKRFYRQHHSIVCCIVGINNSWSQLPSLAGQLSVWTAVYIQAGDQSGLLNSFQLCPQRFWQPPKKKPHKTSRVTCKKGNRRGVVRSTRVTSPLLTPLPAAVLKSTAVSLFFLLSCDAFILSTTAFKVAGASYWIKKMRGYTEELTVGRMCTSARGSSRNQHLMVCEVSYRLTFARH